MRDPELVARAERGARRLESAWENWRAQHGLAAAPGQPIVSYVGYSLTEPWGEPRVVIGVDADEAEYLADFLDRDGGAHVQLPRQHAVLSSSAALPALSASPGSASPGLGSSAPVGIGHQPQPQDQVPGWSPGEFADQTTWSQGERAAQTVEQLAGWQGGSPPADQPPATT